jgi:hypothetical protein
MLDYQPTKIIAFQLKIFVSEVIDITPYNREIESEKDGLKEKHSLLGVTRG